MNANTKALLIVIVVALTLALSACTGGHNSGPGVAAIGPTTTQPASPAVSSGGRRAGQGTRSSGSVTPTQSNAFAALGSSPSASGSALDQSQAEVEYAHCMRSHGVTDFPDPSASGGFQLKGGPSSDLNPTNPTFQKAQAACQSIMGANHGTSAQEAEDGAKLLQYAECMRSHGVPNFPDPFRHTDGGYGFLFTPSLDQSSPTYLAADKACHNLLP
jgi:hypothetical protein